MGSCMYIYIYITLSYVLVLSLMALSHLSVLVRGVWHNEPSVQSSTTSSEDMLCNTNVCVVESQLPSQAQIDDN